MRPPQDEARLHRRHTHESKGIDPADGAWVHMKYDIHLVSRHMLLFSSFFVLWCYVGVGGVSTCTCTADVEEDGPSNSCSCALQAQPPSSLIGESLIIAAWLNTLTCPILQADHTIILSEEPSILQVECKDHGFLWLTVNDTSSILAWRRGSVLVGDKALGCKSQNKGDRYDGNAHSEPFYKELMAVWIKGSMFPVVNLLDHGPDDKVHHRMHQHNRDAEPHPKTSSGNWVVIILSKDVALHHAFHAADIFYKRIPAGHSHHPTIGEDPHKRLWETDWHSLRNESATNETTRRRLSSGDSNVATRGENILKYGIASAYGMEESGVRSSSEISVDEFGHPTIQSEGRFEIDAADIEAKEALFGSDQGVSRKSRSLLMPDIDIDRRIAVNLLSINYDGYQGASEKRLPILSKQRTSLTCVNCYATVEAGFEFQLKVDVTWRFQSTLEYMKARFELSSCLPEPTPPPGSAFVTGNFSRVGYVGVGLHRWFFARSLKTRQFNFVVCRSLCLGKWRRTWTSNYLLKAPQESKLVILTLQGAGASNDQMFMPFSMANSDAYVVAASASFGAKASVTTGFYFLKEVYMGLEYRHQWQEFRRAALNAAMHLNPICPKCHALTIKMPVDRPTNDRFNAHPLRLSTEASAEITLHFIPELEIRLCDNIDNNSNSNNNTMTCRDIAPLKLRPMPYIGVAAYASLEGICPGTPWCFRRPGTLSYEFFYGLDLEIMLDVIKVDIKVTTIKLGKNILPLSTPRIPLLRKRPIASLSRCENIGSCRPAPPPPLLSPSPPPPVLSPSLPPPRPPPRDCAPGCSQSMRNDGVCDKQCNNFGCLYDGGDCSLPDFASACSYLSSCSTCLDPIPLASRGLKALVSLAASCVWCASTGRCLSGSLQGVRN
eukprot:358784-Chlamydomonas_euryale.AAC.9